MCLSEQKVLKYNKQRNNDWSKNSDENNNFKIKIKIIKIYLGVKSELSEDIEYLKVLLNQEGKRVYLEYKMNIHLKNRNIRY